MSKDKETAEITAFYVGRRQLRSGGVGDCWIPVSEASKAATIVEVEARMSLFKSSRRSYAVGGRYLLEGLTEGGRITKIVGRPRFNGYSEGPTLRDDERAEWELAHEAELAVIRAAKLEKDFRAGTALGEELRSIRNAYRSTHPSHRAAFIAVVMEAIRR